MFEECNDKIGILASFDPISEKAIYVKPHFFKWRGRRYKVDTFGGHHFTKRGNKRMLVCGFSSGSNDFTVEFDPETFEWKLVQVYYGH